MKLLEYEAKALLQRAGIAIPASSLVVDSSTTLPFPVVLKSQVPTGGRGKLGGIVVVNSPDELTSATKSLLSLDIKGFTPKTLLVEEKLTIKQELYLSIVINRQTANLQLIAHIKGGIEVEEHNDFVSWDIDAHTSDVIGQSLADYYVLPEQTFALQDLVQHLKACMIENDATLIEINPLILTSNDKLIAGDCKMTLDDAAHFRHDWHFEETAVEANFVTIDPQGTIATIANGAGLAMATVDAAYEAGLVPANFLDIGGGANTETLLKAFNRIVQYGNLKAIVINIFAGITRADEVAYAIVAAKQQITDLPPLFIRLAGTNYEAAETILTANNISIMATIEDCLAAANKVVHE